MSDLFSQKELSFSQAIAATQFLMERINAKELSEAEIKQEISLILTTKNGGRGFFVSYLTSEMTLADHPSPGIINGLKFSAEVASELLVKNLAMSSAMIVTHTRNNDPKNAEGSQRVYQRTSNLIQQTKLELVQNKLQKLQDTIEGVDVEYQEFLERWNYDLEQKKAIKKAVIRVLI
ncbi:MAG: hypothetical protein ACFCU7_07610 [Pleurocapsa sp.]